MRRLAFILLLMMGSIKMYADPSINEPISSFRAFYGVPTSQGTNNSLYYLEYDLKDKIITYYFKENLCCKIIISYTYELFKDVINTLDKRYTKQENRWINYSDKIITYITLIRSRYTFDLEISTE